MRKLILLVACCLFVQLLQAQSTFYYTFAGNAPIGINQVDGKYIVEYPEGLYDPEHLPGDRVEGNYFTVTDTTHVADYGDHPKVRFVYINDAGEELLESGQLLLRFLPTATTTQKNTVISSYHLTQLSTNNVYTLYSCNNDVNSAAGIFETGYVEYCHPNFFIHPKLLYIPNDSFFNKQFYLHNTGQVINDGKTGTADADIDAPEAWNITKGDTNTTIAVLDEGVQTYHYDFEASRMVVKPGCNLDDPNNPNDPNPIGSSAAHGNACAGIIGATQDNGIGVSGIAPKCKLMPVRMFGPSLISPVQRMADALIFADTNGGHILSCSWQSGSFVLPVIAAAIQSATGHNKLLVFGAGNTAHLPPYFSDTGIVVYPGYSAATNPSVICVGASDRYDSVAKYSPRSRYIEIVAPSARGISCNPPKKTEYPDVWTVDMRWMAGFNPWPFAFGMDPDSCDVVPGANGGNGSFLPGAPGDTMGQSFTGRFWGTSAAVPQVAAVAALMRSVNPCISNRQLKDLLLQTADKVGGYNYNWSVDKPGHSKEMGYGRLNAYKAVTAAQQSKKTTLDLYIKDLPDDFGITATPNAGSSPDIWVRNQNDGLTNQVHQNPEFTQNQPVYVYVRVRNKSCVSSSGLNGKLSLYFSKAASWQSWPQNWNGTQATVGDTIGTVNIGTIEQGMDSIYVFQWQPLNPNVFGNWATCLLTRVENLTADPITIYPQRLDKDICYNNNVSIRNVQIVDVNPQMHPPVIGGELYPYGAYMFIGNPTTGEHNLDITFKIPSYATTNIIDEAEVTLTFDDEGLAFFTSAGVLDQDGVTFLTDHRVQLTNPSVTFSNVYFPESTWFPVYVGFNFLVDENTENTDYEYKVTHNINGEDAILGTENFIIHKAPRAESFLVDAGADQLIDQNTSATLSAQSINETAVYNWYQNDSLIHAGQNVTVSPDSDQQYKLEVISTVDGFKGYDDVTVNIRKYFITSIVPNPANNQFTLSYNALDATSASIMIIQPAGQIMGTYTLSPTQSQATINIANYQPGIYNVVLKCDGQVVDAKALSIN